MRRRILQPLKPCAEEPVVDRVPGVRSVEEVALPQLGGCGADGRSGWKCVASDEISGRYGFCRPFPADSLENGLLGGCLASEEVEVEGLCLQDELVNGIIDLLGGVKSAAMRPDAIENGLYIPCYSVEAVVKMAKRFGVEGASAAAKESGGEVPVFINSRSATKISSRKFRRDSEVADAA